ncbi:predicted protein [Sclerotinia sclerotiorum 1980 UF-70]|uniref:Uncharacterized protein n=1 Tax=Sclerotinia sclerotiorum (strain ATCC 18683 / 1980 / Ss-1) TaxID=665079 RepID=A7EYC5_SCLS1|nr:predicted protein [Sclerotinia sclerotiorum 1980 UF-70]EDN94467.1 predicted protein [Sclerotinia sclerotiorum 1980 UF-70]
MSFDEEIFARIMRKRFGGRRGAYNGCGDGGGYVGVGVEMESGPRYIIGGRYMVDSASQWQPTISNVEWV